jgi:hypothetical protein
MKNLIVPSILLVVALLLVGCDQGELVSLPVDEPTQEIASVNTAAEDDENDCGCRAIEATLFSSADFNAFTAEGIIVGDLDGSIMFTGDPNSVAQITSQTFPPLNPTTSSFTSQLEITTDDGMLTTRGVGVAEFGPFGVGAEFHRIIAGTGAFSEATGTLYFNVVADETGANFVEDVSGEICTPCGGDERVQVCHAPPGNPANARTITVSVSTLPAHLAHGDTEGPCEESS